MKKGNVKIEGKTISGTVEDIVDVLNKAQERIAVDKTIEIMSASIKDDFCDYSYEVIEGVGIGDRHGVKGSGIIKDDMRNAFALLNVHMAVIDDVFKHSGTEISDIDTMHGHELTTLFTVTGFKIKGHKEDESVILMGNKYVSTGGRIELETPKVAIDNLSSYKWYNELSDAIAKCRNEVALYKAGKYEPVEEDSDKTNAKQGKLNLGGNEEKKEEANFEDAVV